MEGGIGNDIYYVDTAFDIVRESAGAGFDILYSSVSLQLAAGQEIEVLSTGNAVGTGDINFTGNELNNNIVGNAGVNWLVGGAGDDYLESHAGNDLLDGGLGADFAAGGEGNDIYYVDNVGDVVLELADQGFDIVYASADVNLRAGQSIEVVSTANARSTFAVNFTGNELNNLLAGNDGANTLRGGGGDDYLEAHGGNDILDGGLGADFLVGGAGSDDFTFSTTLGGGNVDRITDFAIGSDRIVLSRTIFTSLGMDQLPADAFVANTTSTATTAAHRLIYNSQTGGLFYDSDGAGGAAAVQFATLQAGLNLSAADFFVTV